MRICLCPPMEPTPIPVHSILFVGSQLTPECAVWHLSMHVWMCAVYGPRLACGAMGMWAQPLWVLHWHHLLIEGQNYVRALDAKGVQRCANYYRSRPECAWPIARHGHEVCITTLLSSLTTCDPSVYSLCAAVSASRYPLFVVAPIVRQFLLCALVLSQLVGKYLNQHATHCYWATLLRGFALRMPVGPRTRPLAQGAASIDEYLQRMHD